MPHVFNGASAQSHTRHKRYDKYARRRYSDQLNAFLGHEATRLTSTAAVLFEALKVNSADRMRTATGESGGDLTFD